MRGDFDPKAPVIIGCDHGGVRLKKSIEKYLDEQGIAYQDIGTDTEEVVRYPYYAKEVAERILSGEFQRGILICSTGVGMSMMANRYPGIRASLVENCYAARTAREHTDANVLCLGGKILGDFLALEILDEWLNARFIGGRHNISLDLIEEFEKK
ncbi:ribose 5-phosphate isomerase B [Clostridium sp. AM58-1XD]|uniref:ribose 5-phosphate isomerase B n=1 Tax=Clostridium sp. AM58-1XD TaxID=2292307 RepID=UPI000E531A7E|nr:ribose 5-phosphate isomerase B [Clostridium sp. AM58-1XD]RGZ00650.1 ribose 5-phosphate isomerase B [Clostridium sp. AM58-1XD]